VDHDNVAGTGVDGSFQNWWTARRKIAKEIKSNPEPA